MLAIIGMYALMGSTFAIFKVLLRYVNDPIFIVSLSMLLGGFIYLAIVLVRKEQLSYSWSDVSLYAQVIIFATLLPQILRFWSLKHLSSIKLGLLTNLSPFITAGIAYFLSVEKMNKRKFIALMIGFIGSLPLLLTKATEGVDMDRFLFISWAELASLLSIFLFSYGFFVRRKMMLDKNISSEMVNCISLLGGGVIAFSMYLFLGDVSPINNTFGFIMWLVFFTLVGKVGGHTIFNAMLKRYHPTFLSFASFLKPFFIMIIGWFFLDEIITWHFVVSMGLVFCGLMLYYQEDLKIYRSLR